MPTYNYVCQDTCCNAAEEHTHSINIKPDIYCPKCQGPMQIAISPIATVFKGGGWAKDNYSSSTSTKE
jgi:putative FmdB family regulatory protein